MTALLTLRGLNKSFALGRRRVDVLQDIDLEVHRGECLGLVGESGSGKTTLALCALRLLPVDRGTVVFDGRDLSGLNDAALRPIRRHLQMVFQNSVEALDGRLTVGQAVAEPLLVHRIVPRAEIPQRVAGLLADVGLAEGLGTRYPHQLSGGQRQRLGIARALATSPRLVIFDEPVSALDVSVRARILELLANLRQRYGLTMLFISHDLPTVAQVADRIAVMYAGRIVEMGEQRSLCRKPRHPYTADLFAAAPVADPRQRRRRSAAIVDAELPPPAGCPYVTRCLRAASLPDGDAECRVRRPRLVGVGTTEEGAAVSSKVDGPRVACHHPLPGPGNLANDDDNE